MLFPCSSVGSLTWQTVPHELLQCGSFPPSYFLPRLLSCVIPEVLAPSLMGSAFASGGSISEPAALALSVADKDSGSFSQNSSL